MLGIMSYDQPLLRKGEFLTILVSPTPGQHFSEREYYLECDTNGYDIQVLVFGELHRERETFSKWYDITNKKRKVPVLLVENKLMIQIRANQDIFQGDGYLYTIRVYEPQQSYFGKLINCFKKIFFYIKKRSSR